MAIVAEPELEISPSGGGDSASLYLLALSNVCRKPSCVAWSKTAAVVVVAHGS